MKLLLICWCLVLCGCARRPASPGGLTFVVGTECHPSARMVGCDHAEPPSCKRIALSYDKACERLQAKP